MRTFGKWLGRILLALILALVAVGFWKRTEIEQLYSVVTLYDEDKIVANFSGMEHLFPTREVPRGEGPVSDLSQGPEATLPEAVGPWVAERTITGLVVLKDGALVHESYYQDTTDTDRRMSFSVAKSFLSALFGVIVAEGHIDSLDDPVVKYATSLKGGAYDGASIRDVLQMSSGIVFDEDYLDFNSDINRMSRVLALGGSMDQFAAGLKETFIEPGTQWQYVSIDTHVLSMVIRGATGRNIAGLLSEKVVQPLGLEASPLYIVDGNNVAFVLGGLNLRTRDYARFGQMFLQNGMYNGAQVVPNDWVVKSTIPSAKTAPGALQYGYQWWMPKDAREGEFFGIGIYGQYIYVNRPLGVVIAMNSADRRFKEAGITDGNIAMFRQIAEAL
ncbi:serine hydrolase [uncultured Shimia sp.]|uniref:serine hydrolase domain-containing protein n=1 Tax=uncultured Shimia sp. TaxID=573152 RepID=UPI002633F186|nr:serine hydrolase [uncultured Shimia sp.]